MSPEQESPKPAKPPSITISLDWWAVIVAVILVAIIWLGIVPSIPW